MPSSNISQLIEEFKKEPSSIDRKIAIIKELGTYIQAVGGSNSDIAMVRELLQLEILNPNKRIAEIAKEEIRKIVNWYKQLFRSITELHKKYLLILINIIKSSQDLLLRKDVVSILGEIELLADVKPLVIEALVKASNDSDHSIKVAAAIALIKIGSPAAVEVLVDILKNGNFAVKKNATLELRQINSPIAVSPLVVNELVNTLQSANPDSPYIRIYTTQALSKIHLPDNVKPSVIDALVKALNDTDT